MSLRNVLAGLAILPVLTAGAHVPGHHRTHFDLQAHRGGIGLTTESTLAGFAKALRLGVTTLELDTQSPAPGSSSCVTCSTWSSGTGRRASR